MGIGLRITLTWSLFAIFFTQYKAYDNNLRWVSTLVTFHDPIGIEWGKYNGYDGVFVSSFSSHSIKFLYEHNSRVVSANIISNSADNIDGSLSHGSVADPSRMFYDDTIHTLFVASRRDSTIRVIDLNSHTISTMQSQSQQIVDFGDPSQYSEFPGMDVQGISGQGLFVSDTTSVYAIGADNYRDISTSASISKYSSVTRFMEINNYQDMRIYSIAPDSNHHLLYISVSHSNNVILSVPISAYEGSHYIDVVQVAGSSIAWSGSTDLQSPPRAEDGYFNAASLAFPMHLRYHRSTNSLYWSEAYPYVGDYLLGSLAIRKMTLSSGYVETVVGVDYSKDTSTYGYIGTTGGYADGSAISSAFRYPISISFSPDEEQLAIADRYNNAVRVAAADALSLVSSHPSLRPTLHPTHIPTLFPSPRPTPYPTRSSRPTVSHLPTALPTLHPSVSIAPTFNPTPRPTRKPSIGPSKAPSPAPTKVRVVVDDVSFFHRIGLGHVHVDAGMIVISTAIGFFCGGSIIVAYFISQRRSFTFQPLSQDSSHPISSPMLRVLRMMRRAPPKSSESVDTSGKAVTGVADEIDEYVRDLTSSHVSQIRIHEEHEDIRRDSLDYSSDSKFMFSDHSEGL